LVMRRRLRESGCVHGWLSWLIEVGGRSGLGQRCARKLWISVGAMIRPRLMLLRRLRAILRAADWSLTRGVWRIRRTKRVRGGAFNIRTEKAKTRRKSLRKGYTLKIRRAPCEYEGPVVCGADAASGEVGCRPSSRKDSRGSSKLLS
jgi:hypothetical protein